MLNPTVFLHINNPAPARDLLTARHPGLQIHTRDSYNTLPGMMADTSAEVVLFHRSANTLSEGDQRTKKTAAHPGQGGGGRECKAL